MRPLGTIVWDHLILVFFFFLRDFQLMASTPDDTTLSLNQDTKQFFV